jgi:hypothetical protein
MVVDVDSAVADRNPITRKADDAVNQNPVGHTGGDSTKHDDIATSRAAE